MKIGKNNKKAPKVSSRVGGNYSKNNILIIGVAVVTLLLIVWVYSMGRKAQETVQVIMYKENIYKNETITNDKLIPYDMVKAEFEKYAVTKADGTLKRRVLLWEEKDKILNTFAAYSLQANTVAEYTDMIISRIDNSDSVLYSFPGKNIVTLDVGDNDLRAFKTFLQPGDRINVVAIYRTTEKIKEDDGYGGTVINEVEVYKEDVIFPDIMLADLLNQKGESILDIYASYNEKTVYQQASLDASESFQDSVTPETMLVALTPEEEEAYYYYLGKEDVEFRISLPQRAD